MGIMDPVFVLTSLVNTCSRIESLNKDFGTTLLITQATYDLVKDEFECRELPEAAVKGKAAAIK
jgi:adenylate cyclase